MSVVIRIIILCFSLICSLTVSSQDTKISIELDDKSIPQALNELSQLSGKRFFYNPDIFDDLSLHGTYDENSLYDILGAILDSNIYKISYNDSIISITKKQDRDVKLFGYILQDESQMTLPYAFISVNNRQIYTTSNESGSYTIVAPEGKIEISVSYLGHRDAIVNLNVDVDTNLDIFLNPQNELEEVLVNQESRHAIAQNRYEYRGEELSELSKETPGVGGNNDLLNTTRSIVGIQSGAGGFGGYFIRGGDNSQNLFLLEGVSIYNPFHSFGLTSIFTPEMTKSLKVYKSGFRAKYGDKSAGIVDIQLKDASLAEAKYRAEVNTQDVSLSIERPIIKNHTSLFISARTTTISGPFNSIIKDAIYGDGESENSTKYYDFAGKIKTKINDKNHLFLTYYKGLDNIEGKIEADDFTNEERKLSWGNDMLNLRWQSHIGTATFLNVNLSTNSFFSTSKLLYEFDDSDQSEEDLFYSNISSNNRDIQIRSDLDVAISPILSIKNGIIYLNKLYNPFNEFFTEDSEEIEDLESVDFGSLESLVQSNSVQTDQFTHHLETNWEFPFMMIRLGLRSTYLSSMGQNYTDISPRLSLSKIFHSDNTISLSIDRTVQFDHLLSSSEIYLPQDLWYPSDAVLLPERAWQINLAHSAILNKNLSLRSAIYYKAVDNVSYTSVDPLIDNYELLNLYIIQGESKSYGLELAAEFESNKTHANVSYVLSKVDLSYDALNLGNPFAAQFDRRHEFKIIGSIQLAENLSLGANVYLASGHPILISAPLDTELGLKPIQVDPSGKKNTTRIEMQHRIDFSVLYQKRIKMIFHQFKLNVYNSYDVNHPLYYTLDDIGDLNSAKSNFSLPLVPSFSYSINF